MIIFLSVLAIIQTSYNCYPASMTMALQYMGADVSYTMVEDVLRGDTQGMLEMSTDFVPLLTDYRLSANGFYTDDAKNIILDELSAGRPLVIGISRASHAVVINGVDGDNVLFINPTDGAQYKMDMDYFLSTSRYEGGIFLVTFSESENSKSGR